MSPLATALALRAGATLKSRAPPLLRLLPSLGQRAADLRFDAVSLPIVLWAVAELSGQAPALQGLLPALAHNVEQRLEELDPNDGVSIVRAAATTKSRPLIALVPALGQHISAQVDQLSEQSFGSLLWAVGLLHARASKLNERLPVILAAASHATPQMSSQTCGHACWGLALSQHKDPAFLNAVAARVSATVLSWTFMERNLDLPRVLCAFAKLQFPQEQLLQSAQLSLELDICRVNSWGLCALAWSFQQLDTADKFSSFQKKVLAEIRSRHLEDSIERSQQGPQAWRLGPA